MSSNIGKPESLSNSEVSPASNPKDEHGRRDKAPPLISGKPIFLGQHSCGPAIADPGDSDGPELIVGDQEGKFIFFKRRDLSP